MSLSLLASLAIVWFRPDLEADELPKKEFWAYKANHQARYDLLAIGDSRTYRGLSPAELSAGTGLSAFNLGFSSGGLSKPLFERTDALLDRSERPTILIGVTPHALTPVAEKNEQYLRLVKAGGGKSNAPATGKELLHKLEPFRWAAVRESAQANNDQGETEVFYRNGWAATSKPVEDRERMLMLYRKNFDGNLVSEQMVQTLAEQVQAWRNAGIAVYLYRVPSWGPMEQLEDSISGFDETQVRLACESAGGVWLDFNSSNYRSYDGSHLDAESALQFSRDVKERIGLVGE